MSSLEPKSDREQLRMLGQLDLGAWIEVGVGNELWSIQHEIASELSKPRARLAVPSCNASGKTFLAARLALAFYDAYTPGAPCVQCDPDGTKGGCRGSKVLTTSSKETHLKDNLWGEIRLAIAQMAERGIEIPGFLPPSETFLMDSPGNHFIRGQVATKEEGFQGYHAAHKLIIGDEATSVSTDVAKGITSLLATADTRLLLIFNPTTPETYAAQATRNPRFKTIRITAFDTPHFTKNDDGSPTHVPEGSNLITPAFLEDLEMGGMGPGSYEWTTRILAQFWEQGDATLIPMPWVELAKKREPLRIGEVGLGIDLAPYGTNESVIAVRRGDHLVDLKGHPAQRVDHFINGDPEKRDELSPVQKMVAMYQPWVIVYDADGVGSGAVGEFVRLHEWAIKRKFMEPNSSIIGFRGGKRIGDTYINQRAGWWWALRKRFERGGISVAVRDPKLDTQLSSITYKIMDNGSIKVESKNDMKQRGVESPDRADAVMYCFAFNGDLPDPNAPSEQYVETRGYHDQHEDAMWKRLQQRRDRGRREVNAVTGVPDDLD